VDALRVATARSLAYAPQFLADRLGYFANEGLTVEFLYGPPNVSLASYVATGRADLVLGSLWFAAASAHPDLVPRIQLNSQCRYFVFGRPDQSKRPFRWSDLVSRRVLLGMGAPTPWVALREILFRSGVPLDEVLITPGFSPEEAVAEFLAGSGDYLMADGEVAEDGQLEEIAAFADPLGPVPWSVYSGPMDSSDSLDERVTKFVLSLARAQTWVHEATLLEIATSLEATFPDVEMRNRVRIVERYRRIQLWARTTELDVDASNQWLQLLWKWGLLDRQQTLADLCGLTA
jgi:NitT/TauT family transport system substrate-binding protein